MAELTIWEQCSGASMLEARGSRTIGSIATGILVLALLMSTDHRAPHHFVVRDSLGLAVSSHLAVLASNVRRTDGRMQ